MNSVQLFAIFNIKVLCRSVGMLNFVTLFHHGNDKMGMTGFDSV